MNSRQKGAAGERELAAFLRAHGHDARRGQQFSGLAGDADVIGLPGYHIECKRVERLNIYAALAQSIRDADAESLRKGEAITPIVAHRQNRRGWLVTLRLEDFLTIIPNKARRGGKTQ